MSPSPRAPRRKKVHLALCVNGETQEVVFAPVSPIVTPTGVDAIPLVTTRSLDAPVGMPAGSAKSVHECAPGAIERFAMFDVRAYVTTPLPSFVICLREGLEAALIVSVVSSVALCAPGTVFTGASSTAMTVPVAVAPRSNVAACSIGRSDGLAPRRILSA